MNAKQEILIIQKQTEKIRAIRKRLLRKLKAESKKAS